MPPAVFSGNFITQVVTSLISRYIEQQNTFVVSMSRQGYFAYQCVSLRLGIGVIKTCRVILSQRDANTHAYRFLVLATLRRLAKKVAGNDRRESLVCSHFGPFLFACQSEACLLQGKRCRSLLNIWLQYTTPQHTQSETFKQNDSVSPNKLITKSDKSDTLTKTSRV